MTGASNQEQEVNMEDDTSASQTEMLNTVTQLLQQTQSV